MWEEEEAAVESAHLFSFSLTGLPPSHAREKIRVPGDANALPDNTATRISCVKFASGRDLAFSVAVSRIIYQLYKIFILWAFKSFGDDSDQQSEARIF